MAERVMTLRFGTALKYLNDEIAIFYTVPWSDCLVALILPKEESPDWRYVKVLEFADESALVAVEGEGKSMKVTTEDVTERGSAWFQEKDRIV